MYIKVQNINNIYSCLSNVIMQITLSEQQKFFFLFLFEHEILNCEMMSKFHVVVRNVINFEQKHKN